MTVSDKTLRAMRHSRDTTNKYLCVADKDRAIAQAVINVYMEEQLQPIDTAPKDGTYVLGYWPEQPQKYDQMYWHNNQWYAGLSENGCREYPCTDPTNWMPLPEPPKEKP